MKALNSPICIIGAGPAGVTASIFLSKMNIGHIIVDAAEFPRDKICGDGLDIKSIRMLHHIDPRILETEVWNDDRFTACWGIRLMTPKGKIRHFEYKPLPHTQHQPLSFTCKRIHFDEFLVKRIDQQTAVFLSGTNITALERAGEEWHITGSAKTGTVHITCNLVIGADGDHSVVLRHLEQRKIDRRFYVGAVRQYWKNIEGMHHKNLMEVYFPSDKSVSSYFWVFPLANGEANVGFGAISEHIAKHKYRLTDIFKEMIGKDRMLQERFAHAEPIGPVQGWGLPLATAKRRASGDGYLLAGDAASIISPFTGEGIGSGMMSGYIAAHFARHAIHTKNFKAETFRYYNREIHKRTDDETRFFHRMQKYPWLFRRLLNLNIEHPLVNYIGQPQVRKWLHTAYNAEIKVELE